MYFRTASAYGRMAGFVLAGWLLTVSVQAQRQPAPRTAYEEFVRTTRTALPVPKTICYKLDRDQFTRILPPERFLKSRQQPNARPAATARFEVTYTNFTAEAQRAFQYAVDIWANMLVSPVPIRIRASWVTQEPGILGSAGPAEIRVGSDGAQRGRAIYPIALAEKIARRDLNNPAAPDIIADFNRNNEWYYGLDGKTPAGQTDLVTAVLHEIAHGLGIIGYFNTSGTTGRYLVPGYASVYDYLIENGQGQRLVTESAAFPDGSEALYRQLTGGDLFANGPTLQQKNRTRVRLHTPPTFDRGSSIYHFNETSFTKNSIDSLNALMTPLLGTAEAIHRPGALVMGVLYDLEWKTTSLLHEPLVSSEDPKDIEFRVRAVSDTVLIPGSVKLFYRKTAPTATDNRFTEATPVLATGSTTDYVYTMPAAVARGDLWYYFQAQDAGGRTVTNPGKTTANAQLLHRVQLGPDVSPPTIRFSPARNFVFTTSVADSLPIYARITDDRQTGVDTAYVEYQVNGENRPAIALRYGQQLVGTVRYDSVYRNRILIPANTLKPGDRISYRIVARDGSRSRNQATSPATGFHELRVLEKKPTRDRYNNTFTDASAAADFAFYKFGVDMPAGFFNPALHSEHPYQNGADFKSESNVETVLLSPIRIKTNPDSATIRFDEVVLVEPGDEGSRYGGSNFYDYVIVEGSRDNGQTWLPLTDGYDARSQADWLSAYNRSLVAGALPDEKNSTTDGTLALFKRREIRMMANGNFRAGEEILIRFRLYADQLAHGWGWAIDNLQIQEPPPPPVLATEPAGVATFAVYPNPVHTRSIRITADLPRPIADATLTITSPAGQTLRRQTLRSKGTQLNEQVELDPLPAGLYFLQLNAGDLVLTQKLLIAH